MQVQCKECGTYKPEREVTLGICDYCFNHPSKSRPEGHRTVTPSTAAATSDAGIDDVVLTTSIDVPNRKIAKVEKIVCAEATLGINVFRDIANSVRNLVGGRADSAQKALAEARATCIADLKREAVKAGADAVIAVSLTYSELSTGSGGGILFVAATGTAVRLEPVQ